MKSWLHDNDKVVYSTHSKENMLLLKDVLEA